jgi:hypothetical protein
MMSIRGTLLQSGGAGKVALGSAMLLIAIATISGIDRQAEAWLVSPRDHSAEFVKTLPVPLAQHALSFPGVRAFQGGVPIQIGGEVLSGMGISGLGRTRYRCFGSGDGKRQVAQTPTPTRCPCYFAFGISGVAVCA